MQRNLVYCHLQFCHVIILFCDKVQSINFCFNLIFFTVIADFYFVRLRKVVQFIVIRKLVFKFNTTHLLLILKWETTFAKQLLKTIMTMSLQTFLNSRSLFVPTSTPTVTFQLTQNPLKLNSINKKKSSKIIPMAFTKALSIW